MLGDSGMQYMLTCDVVRGSLVSKAKDSRMYGG